MANTITNNCLNRYSKQLRCSLCKNKKGSVRGKSDNGQLLIQTNIVFKFQKHRTKTNTRKLQTDKDRKPNLTVGYFWIANRNTGFSIRTVGIRGINTQRITYAKQNVLAKYMSLYKEQLTKPIPATDETHVEGRSHGLACTYWHTQPRSR